MKKTGRKMALLLAAAMLLNPLAELQVKASQEEESAGLAWRETF